MGCCAQVVTCGTPACRCCSVLQTGLELLRQDGRVLQCYRDIHDAIWWVPVNHEERWLLAGHAFHAVCSGNGAAWSR